MATARKKTTSGRVTQAKARLESASAEEVTAASTWRKQASEGTPLRVPSGNVCLVRNGTGMEAFIRNGKIPNGLIPIVEEAIDKGKPPKLDKTQAMNTELIGEIVLLADNIAVYMVLEPRLKEVPLDEDGSEIPMADREVGDFLYVDEVDFMDKMFIFNYAVGGTTDLETFRKGFQTALEPV